MTLEKRYLIGYDTVEKIIYSVLFVLIGLFVFANAELDPLPLSYLLDWQFFVPCIVYAGLVMLVVMGFSELLKLFIKKQIVMIGLSILVGSIAGLKVVDLVAKWFLS